MSTTITSTTAGFVDATGTNSPFVVPVGTTVSGPNTAIEISGGFATLTDSGVVTGTAGNGVQLDSGGVVATIGTASIAGGVQGTGDGVHVSGGSGTLLNQGTVTGGASSAGAALLGGGRVSNASTGVVTGGLFGVEIAGAAGTVVNDGQLRGSAAGGIGVSLAAGGTVANSGTLSGGASGVDIGGSAGTVSNTGTISGGSASGVLLRAGGTVGNAAAALVAGSASGVAFTTDGTLSNGGTIQAAAGSGVTAGGGLVLTNTSGGTIAGTAAGVRAASGTLTNSGTVTASLGSAEELTGGGTIHNASGAVVRGGSTNAGLGASGDGVKLDAGGTVLNDAGATISAQNGSGNAGVYATGGALALTNAGTINGGAVFGVYAAAGGTVENAGTINAGTGTAVYLGGTSGQLDRLILDPGQSLGGLAVGSGSTTNTLELAEGPVAPHIVSNTVVSNGSTSVTTTFVGYGTLAGLGSSYVGFGQVTLDSGADWFLLGTNAIGAGVVFGNAGSIINAGTLLDSGTLINTGTLTSTVGSGEDTLSTTGTLIDAGVLINQGSISGTVTLLAGAQLTNAAGAVMASGATAILGLGAATVTNSGALSGSTDTGVDLRAGGTLVNSGTIQAASNDGAHFGAAGLVINGGTIAGRSNGIRVQAGAGTVSNSGAITGAVSDGVEFGAGGSLTNASTGRIAGALNGVFVSGAAATVTNAGTVVGTSANGVEIDAGGALTNASGGRISGGLNGILIGGAGVGTVSNAGTVLGGANGIELDNGGTVTNAATALVSGAVGIQIGGAPGTVLNSGTILGSGVGGSGVTLSFGGAVSNAASGTISGALYGINLGRLGSVTNGGSVSGAAFGAFLGKGGTLNNAGIIAGTGSSGVGAELALGGIVSNAATATIAGGGDGLLVLSAQARITNDGTIVGTTGVGLSLNSGGTVSNDAGAGITGAHYGVVSSGASTIRNAGTITATGTDGVGVALDTADTLTNASGGRVAGVTAGVTVAGSGSVGNSGRIVGSGGAGIVLGGVGTVSNGGTILGGTGSGVVGQSGGTVANTAGGTIGGGQYGIDLANGAGFVSNAGTIAGTSLDGVRLDANGLFVNQAGGTVSGGRYGADLVNGAGTIVNFGLISGSSGTAVALGGTSGQLNRLILEPGSALVGVAQASTLASNTLELASAAGSGTLAGLGSSYVGFGQVTIDVGAVWTLSGSGTLGPDVLLTDSGTLTNLGELASSGTLIDAGALSNVGRIDGVVTLQAGALFSNAGTVTSGSTPVLATAGGTVSNSGTVAGGSHAIDLGPGASLTNAAGGLVTADDVGVYVGDATASVRNSGTIRASTRAGVELAVVGSLFDDGLILGTLDAGVLLDAGGTVTVGTGGRVSGGSNGIEADDTSTIRNSGTVTGAIRAGILMTDGTVTNTVSGTISSAAFGIDVTDGVGTVTNAGTVAGPVIGIDLEQGGTVTNAGFVSSDGGTAIYLGGTFRNRLILDPGQSLTGLAQGSSRAFNTLELATGSGTGTVVGLGTSLVGFGAFVVDDGASWTVAGSNTILALTNDGTLAAGPGSTLAIGGTLAPDPAKSGTIALLGTAGVSFAGTVAAGETIAFAGAGNALLLANPAAFRGAIRDFDYGDTIDLGSLAFTAGATAVVNAGTLTVTSGGTSASIAGVTIAGDVDFSFSNLAVNRDANGDTAVSIVPDSPTAPVLPASADTGISNSDGITDVPRPTFTGQALRGSTVSLLDTDGTVLGTTTATQAGTYAVQPAARLAEGSHSLTTTVTVAGQGTSQPSAPLAITVDTVAPVLSARAPAGTGIDASGNGDLSAGHVVQLTLASSEPVFLGGRTPSLSLNDGGTATFTGGSGTPALTFATTIQPGQTASDLRITGGALNGATLTDAAGNPASFGGAFDPPGTLAIDTTAPVVTITTPGAYVTDPLQLVSGTGEAGTVVTVTDNGGAVASAGVAPDGTWSAQVGLAGYGIHTLVATDADAAGNVGTSNSIGFGLSAPVPPVPPTPPDTTPPVVTVDPAATVLAPTVVSLSGTATDAAGVTAVQLYNAGALLGSAPVDASGHWTYTADFGAGSFGALAAFASDPSGNLGGTFAPFQLVTGIADQPYSAQVADIDAARNPTTISNYGPDGSLVSQSLDNGDGTHSVQAFANRQVLETRGDDTMTGNGYRERFVFTPGFGHAEVTDFVLGGTGHDTLDLSATGPFTLAQVLHRTTMSGDGAVIHVAPGDTITLDGVTKAQLKAHPKDFAFG